MTLDDKRRRARERREDAARRYQPDDIDLLLVAEAPPADESRYFYFDDVEEHDWLFRGVAEVILRSRPSRGAKASALEELKHRSVFLIDLMPDPIDRSEDPAAHVGDLITRCKALRPRRIVLIKANVFDAAYERLCGHGLPVVNKRVYFPSTGHQKVFRQQFADALKMSANRAP